MAAALWTAELAGRAAVVAFVAPGVAPAGLFLRPPLSPLAFLCVKADTQVLSANFKARALVRMDGPEDQLLELGRKTTPRKVTNPFKFKRLTENNPRQGFITQEQQRKFTRACQISKNSSRDQRHYAVLAILGCHLGWRSKELRDLKVRQVEPETKSIRFYRSQSKNKAGRLMKLPAECWEIVSRYIQGKNPDDYLITRSNGLPIRSMKHGWREIANRARLQGMIFHDLRRTAARNMLRTGVSASVVMEILGWKSFAMLQRYDIVSEADLAAAADKLDAVNGDGHNFGHIELFDGLSGIQNWKTKHRGKNKLAA